MEEDSKKNEETMGEIRDLSKNYNKLITDEMSKTKEELIVTNVGKIDPKRHLKEVFSISHFSL